MKPGSTLVLGETDPELAAIFRAEEPAITWERDHDFGTIENQLALGGRLLDLRAPYATYPEVFLSVHGRHQGDNAAVALAAVESFFESPLDVEVVREAFAEVSVPGRFEVLGHQPLVIVDGAHNPAGADTCATVMAEDFAPVGDEILVAGFLRGRDPAEMLEALRADEAAWVICCTPPSPRGIPAEETAAAARAIGCDQVLAVPDVARACDAALQRATADDAVLVTGSLYVVGEARAPPQARPDVSVRPTPTLRAAGPRPAANVQLSPPTPPTSAHSLCAEARVASRTGCARRGGQSPTVCRVPGRARGARSSSSRGGSGPSRRFSSRHSL